MKLPALISRHFRLLALVSGLSALSFLLPARAVDTTIVFDSATGKLKRPTATLFLSGNPEIGTGGGSAITFGTGAPSGGADGDVYFRTDSPYSTYKRIAGSWVIQQALQPYDARLSSWAAISRSANFDTFAASADYAAMRTALSLGNVNNTADVDKPISTATQTALDAKASTAGPNDFTADNNSFGYKPRVPWTSLPATTGSTTLAWNKKYVGTLTGNFTISSFTGTEANDKSVRCVIVFNGSQSITYPSSYRAGQTNTPGTTITPAAGRHVLDFTSLDGVGTILLTDTFNGAVDLTSGVSGILPVANGGTGTATPGIVAGTGIGVSGTWPNQTVTNAGAAVAETLTNKRITARIATLTDAATVTPATDSYDGGLLATLSQTTTFANPTGTPTDGQRYILRIKSTTIRSISFGTAYRGSLDGALPTATSGSSLTDYLGFIYNSADSKWDLVAKNAGY